jgi:hypothetical protein
MSPRVLPGYHGPQRRGNRGHGSGGRSVGQIDDQPVDPGTEHPRVYLLGDLPGAARQQRRRNSAGTWSAVAFSSISTVSSMLVSKVVRSGQPRRTAWPMPPVCPLFRRILNPDRSRVVGVIGV